MTVAGALALTGAVSLFLAMIFGIAAIDTPRRTERRWTAAAVVSLGLFAAFEVAAIWTWVLT